MKVRTYFKVNRAHLNEANVIVEVEELVPIPPEGTRISFTKRGEGSFDAEVISAVVDIVDSPSLYEQTIYCNGRES
jgi:hypothetical protein